LQHCCLRFLCCSLCLAGRLAAIVHVRLDAKKGLANLARDSAVSGLYQLCDLGHDEVCQLHKEMRGELCLGLNRWLRGRWCVGTMAAAADADAGGWKKGLKWGLGLCIPHTGCCCMHVGGR